MNKDRKKDMSFDGATGFGMGSREVADRVYCGINRASRDGCLKLKIRSETDETEFVRAVWIYLAKMDCPLDIFDCDLDRVETVEHKVMMDTVKFSVEYEAVSSTDGSSKIAECVVKSAACAESGKAMREAFVSDDDSFGLGEEEESRATVSFDEGAFLESLENMSADSVAFADLYETEQMEESEECKRDVEKKHDEDISAALREAAAAGDKYRVVECGTDPLWRSSRMYMVPERYATITYNGEVYTFKAFPFGNSKVSGDKIENDHSLISFVDKRHEELKTKREDILKSAVREKSGWNRTPFVVSSILFAFFVAGFVALSLIYAFNGAFTTWSDSIGMLAGTVVAAVFFVGAVVTFVISVVRKIRRDRAIDAKAWEDIETKDKATASDIEKFSARYKARQLEFLNEKLDYLDLKPATAEELFGRTD